jgi:hypothetical protein
MILVIPVIIIVDIILYIAHKPRHEDNWFDLIPGSGFYYLFRD